jgi:hypothetical protein
VQVIAFLVGSLLFGDIARRANQCDSSECDCKKELILTTIDGKILLLVQGPIERCQKDRPDQPQQAPTSHSFTKQDGVSFLKKFGHEQGEEFVIVDSCPARRPSQSRHLCLRAIPKLRVDL